MILAKNVFKLYEDTIRGPTVARDCLMFSTGLSWSDFGGNGSVD
jgi:hypothetical protein